AERLGMPRWLVDKSRGRGRAADLERALLVLRRLDLELKSARDEGPASTPRCSRSLARRSERAHRVREAGDLAGRAVAVQHALGDRLVELARGPRQRLGGGRVARRDRRAYRAHQVAEMSLQRPVAQPTLLALPMALERRGMVR